MLTLSDYKNAIDLTYKPKPPVTLSEEEKSAICDELLADLLEERNEIAAFSYPYKVKRDLIWGYLNERLPNPVSARFLERQDRLFWAETLENGVVSLDSLEFRGGIALWQGDISRLAADAIVNAANSSLLGCFIPHHKCIDNVIHSRAGVQLRLDCSRIMGMQGEPEPAGCAKITLGYNLPAKYVIHTVGPIYRDGRHGEAETLASCYRTCLALALERDLHSVAFPLISTGAYGYPVEEATRIALREITAFLEVHPLFGRVVVACFSRRDYDLYNRLVADFPG